jgi:cyclase
MLKARIIPCLQLIDESLVKTIKFSDYTYIGDPINTVRIFNELEVDELCFLDIRATLENRKPNFDLLKQLADECFMPLSYGGGITCFEDAKKVLSIGFEKVILNTSAFENKNLVSEIANYFGTQAVVVSIDVKRNIFGKYHVYTRSGTKKILLDPIKCVLDFEDKGAGEIILTSIDKDGCWCGYDLEITKKIVRALSIPVIGNGGAGGLRDIEDVINIAGVSAAALGSMVVFQKKGMGVLVNFPDRKELDKLFN